MLIPKPMLMTGRYPVDVFPPTDFHTSTFYMDPTTAKEYILIIGGLGYVDQASRERTDIYRLDLNDFSMHRVETSGAGPIGGTYNHKAELLNEGEQPVIKITMQTEESQESTEVVDGEESTATTKDEETLVPIADVNAEPRMTMQDGKESATTQERKVFTLRINDMRWI